MSLSGVSLDAGLIWFYVSSIHLFCMSTTLPWNPSCRAQVTTSMANAIRALAMDAVEQAKSGHPGLPMGAADIATVLFTQFLKFDPPTRNGRTATASCCRPATARC